MLALKLLTEELHAPREQAESVAEAVFRHQDLGTEGKITVLGQVLQLATVFGTLLPFYLPLSLAFLYHRSQFMTSISTIKF